MLHKVTPWERNSAPDYGSPSTANCNLVETSDGKLAAKANDLRSEYLIRSGYPFKVSA